MSMGWDLVTTTRIGGQVITLEGIVNSHLGVTLISQTSCLDSDIGINQTSISNMGKLKCIDMTTIVMVVSFTHITTGINLVIGTSLLVGAIPMKGEERR